MAGGGDIISSPQQKDLDACPKAAPPQLKKGKNASAQEKRIRALRENPAPVHRKKGSLAAIISRAQLHDSLDKGKKGRKASFN